MKHKKWDIRFSFNIWNMEVESKELMCKVVYATIGVAYTTVIQTEFLTSKDNNPETRTRQKI